MPNRLSAATLALLLAATGAAAAQTASSDEANRFAPQAEPRLSPDAFPDPDRPVAEIVSPEWWDEDARDAENEAENVREYMGFEAGDVVADIGAGLGYHVVRLAPALGPDGRVVAQDVVPDYLQRLETRLTEEGIENVDLVLGDYHDPRLAEDSLDGAILVHMYHEIGQPYAFLANLAPALKQDARVGIVDLDRPTERHGTPPALLECELGEVGYTLQETHDLGRSGYLAIFDAPAAGEVPDASTMKACRSE